MDTEKYRTGLKRIWAAVIDWIVFLPLLLVERWVYKSTSSICFLFCWTTFMAFVPLIYSVVLHYKYGQTIGNWVADVKVVDVTETKQLTLLQSLYRGSFYLLVAIGGLLYYVFLLIRTEDAVGVLAEYNSFSNNPIFWWTLIELITMLTNAKRRAVHDFIARSVVIRTEAGN